MAFWGKLRQTVTGAGRNDPTPPAQAPTGRAPASASRPAAADTTTERLGSTAMPPTISPGKRADVHANAPADEQVPWDSDDLTSDEDVAIDTLTRDQPRKVARVVEEIGSKS